MHQIILLVLFSLTLLFSPSAICSEPDNSPIKIGLISSLDPSAAVWSESANLGIEQAVKEINQEGGIKGRQIKLYFEDDQYIARNAISAYYKLKDIEKVHFIIGPQFDHTMGPLMKIANAQKFLLISTVGTNPINTTPYSYIIHSAPPDKFGAKALAKRMLKDGRKKVSFLVVQDSYAENFASFMEPHLKGIEKEKVAFTIETLDYKPIALQVKKYNPDAIVMMPYSPAQVIQIYRKLAELDVRLPVYTNEIFHEAKEIITEVGPLAEGALYYVIKFDPEKPGVKEFLRKLPSTPPLPIYSLTSYDTIRWLADLIKVHGTDHKKIKDAVYKMKYNGLFTTYQFDPYGDFPESEWEPWRVARSGFERERYT